MISCSHTLTDEHRYIDAERPAGEFRVLLPRERGQEHGIDHAFLLELLGIRE